MKQKIFSCLCFVLVWAHVAVAHPVFAEDVTSSVVAETQAQSETQAQPSESLDTYIPLIENYYSLITDFVGMDYLHQSETLTVPIKLFDFSNLLRRNIALLYAIRIKKSRFACCVGMGLSSLSYVFSPEKKGDEFVYKTLIRKGAKETGCEAIDPNNHLGNGQAKVHRSIFTVPYGDFLLRLRFNSILDDPKLGFYGWVGAKISFRMNALTKIYYKEYDEAGACLERSGAFNLNKLLVWLQAGLGYHRFGIVGGYSFSSLFKEDYGPSKQDPINPWSIGICIDFF
ncbi:MAG: hypothetical protein K2X94_04935 [Amoebophilaceae bacterium]|nr:hypothetical protein [Amoebophilaceae bacterium]